MVRAQGDPAAITRTVVSQVYAIDRNQPVASVQTLDALLKTDEYATPRFNLALLGAFAVLGRRAGDRRRLRRDVERRRAADTGDWRPHGARRQRRRHPADGGRPRVASAADWDGDWACSAASAAARFLARQVWNVPAFDPLAFAIVSLVLFVAGLQACFWPARRASPDRSAHRAAAGLAASAALSRADTRFRPIRDDERDALGDPRIRPAVVHARDADDAAEQLRRRDRRVAATSASRRVS